MGPLQSMQNNVALTARIAFSANNEVFGEEASNLTHTRDHRLAFSAQGQLQIKDLKAFLQPYVNDAGVTDFGFVHFRGEGFTRTTGMLSTASTKVKKVELRCGSLILDGEVKLDLTDPSVTLDEIEYMKCVAISRSSTMWEQAKLLNDVVGGRKRYTLCSDKDEDSSRFRRSLTAEVQRQAEIRRRVADVEGYTCKLPVAASTVHASPPKAGAFHWQTLDHSGWNEADRIAITHCLELCADHLACAGTRLIIPDRCRYFGHEELKLESSLRPGTWFKSWITE